MAEQEHKRKRDRSPSYPGIHLKEAVEKAETLYRQEGKHKAPIRVILEHWGYQPKSGGGLVALAALKKFGLLEDEGSGDARQAGLSKDGIAIADPDTDPKEKQQLIRAAALRPPIHAALWRDISKDGMPSDSNLRSKLKTERSFTESGAAEFIRQFKATIAYAGKASGDKLGGDGKPPPPPPGSELTPPAGTIVQPELKQVQSVAVTIPVPEGAWPVLNAPLPMPEEDWDAMLDYLKLMRPAFVKKPPAVPQEEPDQKQE
jgi:hypothetical protein